MFVSCPVICNDPAKRNIYYVHQTCMDVLWYEGNSKINLRLVGKKKRIVIAPKRPRSVVTSNVCHH